ncbi:hypothetical protein MIR68_000770 [Amoeboaphelidium protococcarum]|nr:hypothetical protein MIR68_000770 [Amoeboaphelidium protococcarum]
MSSATLLYVLLSGPDQTGDMRQFGQMLLYVGLFISVVSLSSFGAYFADSRKVTQMKRLSNGNLQVVLAYKTKKPFEFPQSQLVVTTKDPKSRYLFMKCPQQRLRFYVDTKDNVVEQ